MRKMRLAASRGREKVKLTFRLLQSLDEEVKRLLRTVNHQLLQQVLKEFVDLVVFQVGFNGLHELMLLEFVHLSILLI